MFLKRIEAAHVQILQRARTHTHTHTHTHTPLHLIPYHTLLSYLFATNECRFLMNTFEDKSDGGLVFELDNLAAVRGFEAFYRFMYAFSSTTMGFHTAAFASMSVVCVSAVVVLFVASILSIEIDVWNLYLIVVATLCNFVIFRGLMAITKADQVLFSGIIKSLRHQITVNSEKVLWDGNEVDLTMTKEELAGIRMANDAIRILIDKIEVKHENIKLYGILPLHQRNLVKAGGAVGAAIFTTILRSVLDF